MKFEKPEKINAAFFKEVFMECLAIFGCLALTGTLVLAVRIFLGKW